jgi:hypothetical protein
MPKTRIIALFMTLGFLVFMVSGCASNIYPGGPVPAGLIYTEATSPAQNLAVPLDKDVEPVKKGTSSCAGVIGLIAVGDAGIEAAMEDGDITQVHHVDHTVQNFLFIFNRDKTIVYGK